MIHTHTQTENNRPHISEKCSSKKWYEGEAGYVEQDNISCYNTTIEKQSVKGIFVF